MIDKEGGGMAGKADGRKRRIWKYLLLGTVFLVAFVWIMLLLGDRMPVVKLPQPEPPPHPNAYDYYLRAQSQLADQVSHTTIGKPLWTYSHEELAHYSTAQKLTFLAQLAPSAMPVREGFRYQCQASNRESVEILDLGRYLSFAARTEAEAQHWDRAVQYSLDDLRVGSDIMQRTSLIVALTGIFLQSTCRETVWQCVDHLSAAQAKAAIARLQDIDDHTPSYAAIITEEKLEGQEMLLSLLKQSHWRTNLITEQNGGLADGGSPIAAYSNGLLVLPFPRGPIAIVLYSKSRILSIYTNQMDRDISFAKLKYPERVASPRPEPRDALTQFLEPVFAKAGFKLTICQAFNRMLLLGCALQAYHAEQGGYPKTLQALVPRYLAKVPDDPFASSGTFRYRRTGARYRLYKTMAIPPLSNTVSAQR